MALLIAIGIAKTILIIVIVLINLGPNNNSLSTGFASKPKQEHHN
jgi:uncharacterized membrane protein